MSIIIDKIEIEGHHVKAHWSDTEDHITGGIDEFNYDEDSAIALCVDLLSRLVITQEAGLDGISLSPANGEAVN